MAYNNYFPMGYQYMYPQQFQQPIQPTSTAQSSVQQSNQYNNGFNGIIWVQGEAGAKSYLVAPNTTVQLWDSESPVIYLKSADASGMPSIKVLDYTIRESSQSHTIPLQTQNQIDMSKYVTWDALEERLNIKTNAKHAQKREDVINE